MSGCPVSGSVLIVVRVRCLELRCWIMRRRTTGTGRTTSVDEYTRQGWREHPCSVCQGRGLRPGETLGYLCAASACRQCAGRGSTWVSPQGRRASYPGGPWLAG